MERDADDEAARLLDRVAGDVPVAAAPVRRVVDAGRRRRRRHWLGIAFAVLLAGSVLLALL